MIKSNARMKDPPHCYNNILSPYHPPISCCICTIPSILPRLGGVSHQSNHQDCLAPRMILQILKAGTSSLVRHQRRSPREKASQDRKPWFPMGPLGHPTRCCDEIAYCRGISSPFTDFLMLEMSLPGEKADHGLIVSFLPLFPASVHEAS